MGLKEVVQFNRIFAGVGTALFISALYLVSNHYHWMTPRELPLFDFEVRTPLIAETIWIYQSIYLLLLSACITLRDAERFVSLLRAMIWMAAASAVVFVIFPVTYPRALYPLPDTIGFATRLIFEAERQVDSPANCLPSLHVSVCFLIALASLRETRQKFAFYLAWASLIAVSTLTTKQHYFVDVVSGIAFASIAYWIFCRERVQISQKVVSSPRQVA